MMRIQTKLLLGFLTGIILIAGPSWLAPAGTPVQTGETWTDPGTAGWSGSASAVAVTNPGGYLNIAFEDQSQPELISDVIEVDFPWPILITNLSCRFRSADVFPSSLRAVLHVATNNHTWMCALKPAPGPEWQLLSLGTDPDDGWSMGPDSTPERFNVDLRYVSKLGIYLRRHGDTGEQNYELDDVVIQGLAIATNDLDADGMLDSWETANSLDPFSPLDARIDSDLDRMSNYEEFRARTNPWDPDSRLLLKIERPPPGGLATNRVVLRWDSSGEVSYRLIQRDDLMRPDTTVLKSGIGGDPPTNMYETVPAPETRSGYYHLEVQ